MSPSQYVSVGVTTAMLIPVITWLTHWPIQPPSNDQVAAVAGLLIAAGGAIHAMYRVWRPAKTP